MSEKKRKSGHPSPYEGREVEIAMAIAERLKTGESMVQILRENSFPKFDAVHSWRARFPEIDRILRDARAEGCDALAAQCIEIADEVALSDSEDKQADVAAARLRIDTRLRLLGKWDPKRYGEKVEVEHSGGTNNTVTVMDESKRKELLERRQRALEAGKN